MFAEVCSACSKYFKYGTDTLLFRSVFTQNERLIKEQKNLINDHHHFTRAQLPTSRRLSCPSCEPERGDGDGVVVIMCANVLSDDYGCDHSGDESKVRRVGMAPNVDREDCWHSQGRKLPKTVAVSWGC